MVPLLRYRDNRAGAVLERSLRTSQRACNGATVEQDFRDWQPAWTEEGAASRSALSCLGLLAIGSFDLQCRICGGDSWGTAARVPDVRYAGEAGRFRIARCRGCGVQFELDARTNPASAAAFRCKKCRQISFSNFF